ncbi:MAG: hypothetical protein LBH01_10295 [Verrucomicrobiales bacterium]|nr:hypothetical protein [Verrucomicrobiales bacterium]
MKKWLLWLLTALVSLVFIVAGMSKFASPENLVAQLHALRLPVAGLFPWLALWLPILEILLGVALWFKNWRTAAWLGILPLTILFSLVITWAWLRGLNVSCGCFGDVLHFSMPAALLRNVVILAVGSWALCGSARRARD